MSTRECIFCNMAQDSTHEAPIYRDERVFVVRDIDPKAPVHLLIIPNLHLASLAYVGPGQEPIMGHLFRGGRRDGQERGCNPERLPVVPEPGPGLGAGDRAPAPASLGRAPAHGYGIGGGGRLDQLELKIQRRVDALPGGLQAHVYRVRGIAIALAERHGLNSELAALGMLAHDVARAMPDEDLVRHALEMGLPVGTVERRAPVLLHGPVGAELLRREEGLADASLYRGVYWHSTLPSVTGRAWQGHLPGR